MKKNVLHIIKKIHCLKSFLQGFIGVINQTDYIIY